MAAYDNLNTYELEDEIDDGDELIFVANGGKH